MSQAEAIANGMLFELCSPDGHVWKLYENGKIEGFPERTLVINYAAPVLDALRSRYIQQIKERSYDQKIGVKLIND